MKAKVVFHIDSEEKKLLMTLNNIENLLKEIPAKDISIYVVANGTSVKLLKKENAAKYIDRMKKLSDIGVKFLLCNNSLRKQNIRPDELLEFCKIVPAGVVELIRLQKEGCAYIKP
ncbi:hypothetical protein Dester_1193 [Desulfurobacterium thermolithotrophum DSM 11699]|uniref:Uncharacterized protein n=1 Tax=Desulfurobacterium thermolithotrophum (strain DSM 11699 / BSA) TaxID=868864 RepID=F0S0M6_DESTD|nr:DsrE family protein [Desulfurobacterium thermolithotrophum]ADY73829.1 hypothetical protein Dester_1193 [Desulfurobacterium thermolithotrophum DSM 11699]